MNQLSIKEFYSGKSVFITGATGFIGKTLVEKLLWSCPGIENIFIIVRSKKGKNVQERVEEVTNSPCFDRIRAAHPEYLKKIIALEGDITMENLGMSPQDLERFYEKVNVIFHSAASIRMDESVKDAINNNTLPTKRLIAMGKKVKNLEVFVHISTAFSNWYRDELYEVPYLPPYDPNDIIKKVQTIESISEHKELEKQLLNSMKGSKPFPNTYTLTKFFAENFVVKEGEGIPRAIVRPSIVISSLNEPMPGWIDNWGGSTERVGQVSNGIFHHVIGDPNLALDLIPADMVINCTIAAAYKTALEKPKEVPVYHCSSSISNPILFDDLFQKVAETSRKFPFERVLWYPWVRTSNDFLLRTFMPPIFHWLPAYVIDFALKLQGKKPRMIRHHQYALKNYLPLIPFATIPSKFYSDNSLKLSQSLLKSDQKEFPFDIRTVNWKQMIELYTIGVKKFLLKEDCSEKAIRKGQAKMKRLKMIHHAVKYAFIGGSLLLLGKVGNDLRNYLSHSQDSAAIH